MSARALKLLGRPKRDFDREVCHLTEYLEVVVSSPLRDCELTLLQEEYGRFPGRLIPSQSGWRYPWNKTVN